MKVTDFEAGGALSLGVDEGESVSEAESEESVGVGGWRAILGLVRPSVEE